MLPDLSEMQASPSYCSMIILTAKNVHYPCSGNL